MGRVSRALCLGLLHLRARSLVMGKDKTNVRFDENIQQKFPQESLQWTSLGTKVLPNSFATWLAW